MTIAVGGVIVILACFRMFWFVLDCFCLAHFSLFKLFLTVLGCFGLFWFVLACFAIFI